MGEGVYSISVSYKMRSAMQQFIWLSIVVDVSIGKISVLSLSRCMGGTLK